jgi:hypothetical protein
VESFQKSLEIRPDRETRYGLASCLLRRCHFPSDDGGIR